MNPIALLLPHPFHHKKALLINEIGFAIYAFLFLCVGIGLVTIRHVKPEVLSFATNITAGDVIKDTNQERTRIGDKPVTYNAALSLAAEAKAHDMFAKNYWAHFGPNGETPWSFIQQAGYGYAAAGENLARDFNDSNAVVDAWMHSPSHRENLLNNNYQDIGVAVVNGNLLGHETTLVVQMFGRPYGAAQISSAAGSTTAAGGNVPSPQPSSLVASFETANSQVGQATYPQPEVVGQPSRSSGINYPLLIRLSAVVMLLTAMVVLVIDTVTIRKRDVSRLATHSFSHVAILSVIVLGILLFQTGSIL